MIALVPKAIKFYIASEASTMKPILSLLFALVISISFAQPPSPIWQWAKRTGSSGDNLNGPNSNEAITDVQVDKHGNIYAVGTFFSNTAFQNAQLFGQTTPLGYGQGEGYLLKYNSCGSLLWYRRIGGTNVDGATSLVIDKAGKVVVTGYSYSNPSLYSGGGYSMTITGQNSNGPQFIAKYDTSGTLLSVNTYPFDYTKKILVNSAGNYIISNGLSAAVINTLGAVTSTMAFIAPTPFYPQIPGITIDRNDNIYLAGYFNNTINVGPGTILLPTPSTLIANVMAANSILMKFSLTGTMQWYVRGNTTVSDALSGLTLDTGQTKIITGGAAWNGSTVFGYPVIGNAGNSANAIYYLSSSNGSFIAGLTGSRNYQGLIVPIATDRADNVHCIGAINGFLSFGANTYTSNGLSQSCIGKLDPQGNFNNIQMIPQAGSGSQRESPICLTISEEGNVYIGGMFGGTLDSAGTAVNIVGGLEDGFIAKYGFPCGSTLTALSPLAPSNLTATYQGTLTNLINWVDNSNYETGFELWYNGPTPTFSLLTTLPPNTTSYTHTALNYSTTYCYAARAINAVGPSVFTNTDCATTPAMAAPQAPTSLVANNTGTLINTVNWVDNSFNETGFELWYHDASPTFSLLATLPANTNNYQHSGLSYTTTYCYKALAINAVGPSAFTNTDCASTPQIPAPAAPSTLAAVNSGSLSNQIVWLDNSNNETGFNLWYTDASQTYSLLTILPANTTTYTHSGLNYSSTYCYKVSAQNAGGASPFTNTDCATTPAELIDSTTAVGLKTYNNLESIKMYPNPAKGSVFVWLPPHDRSFTLLITDIVGRVLDTIQFSAQGESGLKKLDLDVEAGTYFIHITCGTASRTEKLLIE